MKAGDLIKKLKNSKSAIAKEQREERENQKQEEENRLDLLLIHCDLFYEMEFSNVNIGLVYIATYLKQNGFKVEILTSSDIYKTSQFKLQKILEKKNPRIIGFYVISDNFELVTYLAHDIKQWMKDVHLVAGGPLASADPDLILNKSPIDLLITGEGEFATLLLLKYIIKKEGNIKYIPGLMIKRDSLARIDQIPCTISDVASEPGTASDSGSESGITSDGGAESSTASDSGAEPGITSDSGAEPGITSDSGAEPGITSDGGAEPGTASDSGSESRTTIFADNVFIGSPPLPIEDLDRLPFPGDEFFTGQQVFQVVSGRGCPYRCTFCFQTGHGLKFRFRSAENVLMEIEDKLNKLPMVGFDFIDDAFIMDPARCIKIGEGLAKYRRETGRNFIFFCQGRVNILDKHPEILPTLAKAGLAKMQIGIESGDERVLKAYKKGITISQVRNSVQQAKRVGSVVIVGGFILGGPFESETTFQNTLELACELIESAPGIFEASAGFLGAYPGTQIAQNPEKFGLQLIERDFVKGPSLGDVQFRTQDLDRNRISQMESLFLNKTAETLAKNLHRIPPSLIKLHFQRAEVFRMYSLLYQLFLSRMKTVKNYLNFSKSPRFSNIDGIPEHQISLWKPMRVIDKISYSSTGEIYLPYSIQQEILQDRNEILLYQLASGKLSIMDIIRRWGEETGETVHDPGEIFNNLLLPFYRRMENNYQIIFYR